MNCHEQINDVAVKLNKAHAILSKVRHFVHKKTIKTIYYAIFESQFFYSCLVWAQNINSIKKTLYFTKEIFAARVLFES